MRHLFRLYCVVLLSQLKSEIKITEKSKFNRNTLLDENIFHNKHRKREQEKDEERGEEISIDIFISLM